MAYLTNAVTFGSPQADAFGRGRVSNPQTLFNTSFEYDTQPLLMQYSKIGAGSIAKTANVSSVTLSTGGTGATDGITFQSKGYYRYEPGKSLLITLTGVLGPYKQYVRSRIGYCDTYNGIFFVMDGTSQGATGTPGVGVRTNTSGSPVDTVVLQPNWNIDKMDGTGPSGITADWSKTQFFVMDLEWQGVGRVRFGLNINGILYYVHQIVNANVLTVPYMNTACLPAHYSIYNTSSSVSGATTMSAICLSIVSEGGNQYPVGLSFAASNGVTSVTAGSSSRTPLVSIQPKLTFNGANNRSRITLEDFNVYVTGTPPVFFEIVYNGNIQGGLFQSVDTNSVVNFNANATSCAGGNVIVSGYSGTGGGGAHSGVQQIFDLEIPPFTLDITGTVPDSITLCASGIGSTSTTFGELDWLEHK